MGLSRNLSLILGGATACTYLVASFIPLWVSSLKPDFCIIAYFLIQTVERFGRRALLMTSAAGLSSCFIIVSALLSTGSRNAAYAATAFVFIFQIFLGIVSITSFAHKISLIFYPPRVTYQLYVIDAA
jgi:hypothetical protein